MKIGRRTWITLTDEEKAMWNTIVSIIDEIDTATCDEKCEDDVAISEIAHILSENMTALTEYFEG